MKEKCFYEFNYHNQNLQSKKGAVIKFREALSLLYLNLKAVHPIVQFPSSTGSLNEWIIIRLKSTLFQTVLTLLIF